MGREKGEVVEVRRWTMLMMGYPVVMFGVCGVFRILFGLYMSE